MNIYSNGYVYENTYNEYITKAEHEIYLNSILYLDMDILVKYFKGNTVIPVFRFFVLKNDESVDYEISRDVMNANLSISYQSGQRRSMNITLINVNGFWKYGARNTLWNGMKFRLDCGAVIGNTVYWQQQGVFLLQNITPTSDGSNKTISLSLCDKWGLWDGSVYGNTQFKTIIPQGIPMKQAFDLIIHEDDGTGNMWDVKPIIFNNEHWSTNTYYTIKQDAGQLKSDNLLTMAKTISSDIYYDRKGCCRVEGNSLDFINNNFSSVWRFEEGDNDCSSPTLTYNKSKYYNKIITKGNIVNGYQFSAEIENRNRKSLYNTIDCPIMPKVNNNTKLYSDTLCLEQCMKEMVEQSRGLLSVSLKTGYLPFLDVNNAVYLSFPSVDIGLGLYIIDSISYNIGTICTMDLSLTSNTEVIF